MSRVRYKVAGRGKIRLDRLLVERNCFSSRSRAAAEIMAGNVFIDGARVDKPGTPVHPDAELEVRGRENPYVSRGGLKLQKAIGEFGLALRGKVVLDIGASTGGFTHCALLQGAVRVYALDVGYGQLDWKLRNDPRVVNMERKNVRFLKKEDLPEVPHLATIDVSFISLRLVFPVVAQLGVKELFCLVKPQFEASPSEVGKKGVVKSPAVHAAVLERTIEAAEEYCYFIESLGFSPVKGPQGNIEYLAYFSRHPEGQRPLSPAGEAGPADVQGVVARAHQELGEGH